jgi:type VI secretion system secreted protein VgrG
LIEQVCPALAGFASATRLYELTFPDGSFDTVQAGCLVETFGADEQLQTIGARDIIVLSTNADLDLAPLLGQRASLPDGSRSSLPASLIRRPCWATKAA